ncbi:MAG: nicotinate (nicotinamide) nucleotide adenylyltransferase [Candidatus Harrisonbacteria bacterium]|nr:nicotinate (nicotinamide) nucleotide adenylyltransferase [Candidatus Harrisonbacteria bacterium]
MTKNSGKRIVIFGGAFNPPHLGHVSVIRSVLKKFPCDEIWVMPSADRHDKAMSVSGQHRFKMVEILIKELFQDAKVPIKIPTLELDRPKLTTTYETKTELENQYPDFEFYFVVGSDSFNDIKTKWVNGEKLYKEANFIVLVRPGISLPENLPKNVMVLERNLDPSNFSSTDVRSLIASGKPVSQYLSKGVSEYIKENNLYKVV